MYVCTERDTWILTDVPTGYTTSVIERINIYMLYGNFWIKRKIDGGKTLATRGPRVDVTKNTICKKQMTFENVSLIIFIEHCLCIYIYQTATMYVDRLGVLYSKYLYYFRECRRFRTHINISADIYIRRWIIFKSFA